jgi:hypothetical protein
MVMAAEQCHETSVSKELRTSFDTLFIGSLERVTTLI